MTENSEDEDENASRFELVKKRVFFSYENSDDEEKTTPSPKPERKKVSFIQSVYISPIRREPKTTKSTKREVSSNSKNNISKKVEKDVIHMSSNVNILEIDKKIRDILNRRIDDLPSLRNRLEQLRWIKDNSDDTNECLDARKEVWHLNNKIREIESNTQKIMYEKKISPILEEYRNLVSKPITKSFIHSDSPRGRTSEAILLKRKKEILYSFINIAQNYIEIKISSTIEKKILTCENCGSQDIDTTGDETYICNSCSACMEIMDDTPSFRDNDHINLSGRYIYTKPGHFSDVIKRFEAQQNVHVSKRLYDTVDKEMVKHKFTKETLTKRQLYTFLDQGGYSKHYKNINLIYSKITGKPPPNIEKYKKDLLSDLKLYEDAFEEIKGNRKNSLKVMYKLLKLLERRGYETTIDDFYILDPEKLREHDEFHEKVCKKLGWEYKPTI